MSGVDGVSSWNQLSNKSTNTDRMNDLTTTDFIKMMVAELENQDPMSPMSNTEMLSQINQLRQITSSDKLSQSIESLTTGQSLTTASSMIGKTVSGVNTLGEKVTGNVEKVSIENGVAKLHVGSSIIEVEKVTGITS
ncbi:MAG: flagellar hook assembly protein FlgD [Thermoguttaceae bacterium]